MCLSGPPRSQELLWFPDLMAPAQSSLLCNLLQAPSWPLRPSLPSCELPCGLSASARPAPIRFRAVSCNSALSQVCSLRLHPFGQSCIPLDFKASTYTVLGAGEFQEGLEEDSAATEPLSTSLLHDACSRLKNKSLGVRPCLGCKWARVLGPPRSRRQCWPGSPPRMQLSSALITWSSVHRGGCGNSKAEQTVSSYLLGIWGFILRTGFQWGEQ